MDKQSTQGSQEYEMTKWYELFIHALNQYDVNIMQAKDISNLDQNIQKTQKQEGDKTYHDITAKKNVLGIINTIKTTPNPQGLYIAIKITEEHTNDASFTPVELSAVADDKVKPNKTQTDSLEIIVSKKNRSASTGLVSIYVHPGEDPKLSVGHFDRASYGPITENCANTRVKRYQALIARAKKNNDEHRIDKIYKKIINDMFKWYHLKEKDKDEKNEEEKN